MKRPISDRLTARAPALTPCPACQNPLSATARSCPRCGHVLPRRKMSGAALGFLLCIAALGIFLLWSYIVHESHEDLRRMQRDGDRIIEDISTGRYREPVPVRITK